MTGGARGAAGSVLMVINGRPGAAEMGVPTFVASQRASLEALGWKVDLCVLVFGRNPLSLFVNRAKLKRMIRERKPDVVHAQYGSLNGLAASMAAAGRRFVVSFCGDDLLGTPAPGLVWRVHERLSYLASILAARRAAAVVVKSRNLLEGLPQRLRPRVSIVPNGVDLGVFAPADRRACRQTLGWDAHAKVVLFNASSGENAAVKNPELARAAVRALSRRRSDVELKMISGLAAARVCQIMNAADCLLVTSLHEGSPNVVKEAMACNLPVVSVPCGDVRERLAGTRPGDVRSYDAEDLAEGIDLVLRAAQRSNGRQEILRQNLSLEAAATAIDRLYAGE